MRQQLALALSQQAETVQRVERSLREQEQALAKVVGERLDRTEKATGQIVTDLRERLVRIDEAQKKIGELSTQVVSLQEVLSNKQARGAFGEVQLNDLVSECAAAVRPTNSSARCRPARAVDCLLQLPNPPGSIAIDAKFPLESYQLAARRGRPATQRRWQSRSAPSSRRCRKHIGDIRDKYIVPGETAESALMFLPSEAIYAELHANFTGLVDESYRARVWIVSPTTMMATLNTVRAVLKDVQHARAGRRDPEDGRAAAGATSSGSTSGSTSSRATSPRPRRICAKSTSRPTASPSAASASSTSISARSRMPLPPDALQEAEMARHRAPASPS